MKKKILVLFLALMLLPLAGLAAQAGGNNSYDIMSFEIGYAPLYDFTSLGIASPYFSPLVFGFNIRIADPLSIGFVTYQQTGTSPDIVNLTMLRIKYDIVPQARVALSYGYDAEVAGPGNAVGFGIEGIPFQRKVGSLSTEFKLAIDYFWLPTVATKDLDNGKLVFTLAMGVGI
jgi:hypothetical protein